MVILDLLKEEGGPGRRTISFTGDGSQFKFPINLDFHPSQFPGLI
jgi:hypothetical protein